jgi:hypothetical protein
MCNSMSCALCKNLPLVGNSLAVVEGNDPAEGDSILGLAGHSNRHRRRRIDSRGSTVRHVDIGGNKGRLLGKC